MTARVFSLRIAGPVMLCLSFGLGAYAAGLWFASGEAWRSHLQTARHLGELIYDAEVYGAPVPGNMTKAPLAPASQGLATAGDFARIAGLPRPALVTYLSLATGPAREFAGPRLQIALVSPSLHYPLADLALTDAASGRDTVGGIVALMATYCSDAVMLIQRDGAPWQRIAAPDVWSCNAAPADLRLLALLIGALAITGLVSAALNTAAQFTQFAEQLAARQQLSGPDPFAPSGPEELRRIIAAFNRFREVERQHLAERALILSGVTHDLGTPAQRLKLRASLIEDTELRDKLVGDIDQMTGIIESVLTYTRTELSTEDPRRFSLSSLVSAVVEDFQDTGQPVTLEKADAVLVEGGASIFMSRKGHGTRHEQDSVIITGRPVSLRRALSNLIDNAVKYGRRAIVRVETDATQAHILVEDAGGAANFDRLEGMTAPFTRGGNAEMNPGFGMGLTIVSAVAAEHGGALLFIPGHEGIIARLSIQR